MALNWDISGIKDNEKLCWVGDGEDAPMNPKTDQLIWTCMFVGIPSITAENVLEFWSRMCAVYVQDEWTVRPQTDITFLDVVKHIGLKTNASRYTSAQFFKHQNKIRKERMKKPFTAPEMMSAEVSGLAAPAGVAPAPAPVAA